MKIDPSAIAFDIDGVFGDIVELFIRVARERFGIEGIVPDQITTYFLEDCLPIPGREIQEIIEIISSYPRALEMTPYPGAQQVLTQLSDQVPLCFVTARRTLLPIREWVCRTLPQVDPAKIKVIATGDHNLKGTFLKELGYTHFVEDHLETCHTLPRYGITPLLYAQPWNQAESHAYLRIQGWEEIEKLLN
jgi:5'(3')-deoxyribonucleotidase